MFAMMQFLNIAVMFPYWLYRVLTIIVLFNNS